MLVHIYSSDNPSPICITADLTQDLGDPAPGIDIGHDDLNRLWSFGASVDAVTELLELVYSFAVSGDMISVDGFTYEAVTNPAALAA